MSETFKCAMCKKDLPRSAFHEISGKDRKRPVKSECKECRKELRYIRLYLKACDWCGKNRPLNKNGTCVECNELRGLRQCVKCGEILPIELSFSGKKRTCQDH